MLFQMPLDLRREPVTASHRLDQLLVEGVDGLPIIDEQIGLEEKRGDDERLAKECD